MHEPNRKVNVGALAGAATVVVVWIIGDVPAEVAVAFSALFSFVLSYWVPERD